MSRPTQKYVGPLVLGSVRRMAPGPRLVHWPAVGTRITGKRRLEAQARVGLAAEMATLVQPAAQLAAGVTYHIHPLGGTQTYVISTGVEAVCPRAAGTLPTGPIARPTTSSMSTMSQAARRYDFSIISPLPLHGVACSPARQRVPGS